MEKGLRSYVRMRQKVAVSSHAKSSQEKERFTSPEISSAAIMAQISGSQYHSQPAKFPPTEPRSQKSHPSRPRLRDVYRPVHLAEASEMEIWLIDLWKDFLLEPTPYLVLSATLYLGLFIILLQYYPTILNIAYFLIQLIPWDDDFGAPGYQF
ncbi:uncharacterized protein EAF02_006424 [Botrytis sinoallii]|uniref:uncharacterized protein n=1 Tax=Botrytis sinoallii TaxID=1463999 RepID=UPI0018FF7106|nr:uncharacterized protein EAF02_006424 [Botrytis sinoallii]KAF7881736.1 hypothetical protein EAF02_006424 [Botrytis sinoallii]